MAKKAETMDDVVEIAQAEMEAEDAQTKTKEAEAEAEPTADERSREEILSELNATKEMVGSLHSRLDDMQKAAQPAAEPAPAKEEGWVPSSWEDVKKLKDEAKEEAKQEVFQTLEERAKEYNSQIEANKKQEAEVEKYFEDSFSQLEKAGILAKIEKADDPADKGKAGRRELLLWAAEQGSGDILAASKTLDDLHKQGFKYDDQQKKIVRSNYMPAGYNSTVSSSNRSAGAPTGTGLTRQQIHTASFDDIVDRFMGES